MKRILGTLVVLCITITNYGQTNTYPFPSSGSLGIGTTSPSELLHIESNGITKLRLHTESIISNSGISLTGKRDSGINSNHYIGTTGANNYNLTIDVDESLLIRTNATTRMFVHGNGNVGIGSNNPSETLHIVGNSLFDAGNGTSIKINGYHGIETTGNTHWLHLNRYSNDNVSIGHNSTSNVFMVYGGGNVGIGTTTPDSKLTVKGNIHAEEVKVDLSVPGPDYVFKEDYDLKSLEEVQNYIKEHGHLPNIPSAKEMEVNGIQLGEMDMKLLEKIEELTLYILNQEKKLQEKDARIQEIEESYVLQEKRLQRIEKLLNQYR